MIQFQKVSVVIPTYNDAYLLPPIIREILLSKYLGEIIVVDDGSDIQSKQILSSLKGIKLITYKTNRGKSQALKTGVSKAKFDFIVFIDSDLNNFKSYHLDQLVIPVINKKCHMTISDREYEQLHSRASGFSIAFTGDRCIPKSILVDNSEVFSVKGYLIESSINSFFIKHNLKVRRVLFDRVSQSPKAQKIGFEGWLKDYKMLANIVEFLGAKEFVRQLHYFSSL